MRRTIRAVLPGVIAGLLVLQPAAAQSLEDICPGAAPGIGALWGEVRDADAELVIPGANVVALWSMEGEEQRYEAKAGAQGIYAMCLPMETPLSVTASFASTTGAPGEVTMTEEFTRHDLSLAMPTGTGGADQRLWLCVNGGQSIFNNQFSRLLRCDESWQPLERCPKTELGRIMVQPAGAGSGMLREMVERLVEEANRIGANAVINLQDSRGRTSFIGTAHQTSITGEGVRIDVDPTTC